MTTSAQSVCARCGSETIHTLATSPVVGVWEVRQCGPCGFTWRTTEPARRIDRKQYPAAFRLTASDLTAAPAIPTVPPLVS
ncbi:non-oxidative hydroxyarylic acid decarboxylases subunit D [Nocardia macrotermitis]|uniref:Phenolic acid decarboxylase subunit D n=1 Tax=Nocardia macrotermitis TaxID=2585198 RepID=A0A7K0D3M4_9NOCA|nr:non-oxidative hydroxyarylic acid decarboxylases subunit D [Nocardia macrotermitis]MQY20318.1 Phenolic acid decarboxylase subunit D [Nocardia macrotermitis]